MSFARIENFEISQLNDSRLMLTWAQADQTGCPGAAAQWRLQGSTLVLTDNGADSATEWHFEPIPSKARSRLRQASTQALLYAALDEQGQPVNGGAAHPGLPEAPRRVRCP